MERSGMAFIPRNSGSAHKAVTLDLMLRTFMNSPDFQPNNPKMWEGIARLVPGTTAQQCLQRWEELRSSSRMISRDLSCISARGKLLSPNHEQHNTATNIRRLTSSTSFQLNKQSLGDRYQFASVPELPPIYPSSSRPSTAHDFTYDQQYRGSMSQYRLHSGQFTAAFCQSQLYGGKKKHELEEDNQSDRTNIEEEERVSEVEEELEMLSKTPTLSASVSSPCGSSNGGSHFTTQELDNGINLQRSVLLIHVKDEAKKVNKDFTCPRNVLIKEMRYFDEYLSSPNSNSWEEVDISVHCDVAVFHWLMKYAKRGMMEGPSGEQMKTPLEPDKLDPFNVVSILISSDFLKMDNLVEECIQYCCDNLSQVISTPCNMHCIGGHLLERISKRFTPLELEKLEDPKDKIKNKLFVYKLETMFSTESPPSVNGVKLFKCKHCGCLLTQEQQLVFPCANYRLKVDRSGALVYQHEGEELWDINRHVNGLRKQGMTWREIYWKLWGVVNWFKCTTCEEPFQCHRMGTCLYHPGVPMERGAPLEQYYMYSCCNKPVNAFTPLLSYKNGCCSKDHTVDESLHDSRSIVDSALSLVKDLVCEKDKSNSSATTGIDHVLMTSLLENEEKGQQNQVKKVTIYSMKKRNSVTSSNHSLNSNTNIKKAHSDPLTNDETKLSSMKTISKLKKGVKMTRRALEDEERETSSDDDDDESSNTSSDMEEEDEPDQPTRTTQKQKATVTSMKLTTTKQKRITQSKKSLRNMADWEWDSSKSTRWNQDMQRHEDDRRMNNLRQQLQQLSSSSSNDRSKNVKSSSSKLNNQETSNSGGIFCRIEAQFRAQRMVANGIAVKQSGHRSFRKSNYSSKGLIN